MTRRHTFPPLRGLERWLRAGGIEFTTWDRWFLALVAADHGSDWQALRERLRPSSGISNRCSSVTSSIRFVDDLAIF
jgi:hypothetical protein